MTAPRPTRSEMRLSREARRDGSPIEHTLKIASLVLLWLSVYLGITAFALGRWMIRTFGYVTPDQALMNLQGAGGEAVGGGVVKGAVLNVGVVPVLITTGMLVIWLLIRWVVKRSSRDIKTPKSKASTAALAVVSLISITSGGWSVATAIQLREYLAANDPSLDVGQYYAEAVVHNEPDTPSHNLIVVYLESVEDSLADDSIFETNMLEGLQAATEDFDAIPRLEQYKNFGWTMAGIVGTQCGVPLRAAASSPIDESANNDAWILNDWSASTYMPGAVCLGDILAENGYTNVFLGGAFSSFAGKGTFFASHGYQEVLGREDWTEAGLPMAEDWWGLSDSSLFEQAEGRLLELRESGSKFALTLLTLDTHEPAYLQAPCELTTEIEMESIARCSTDAVADFIEFLRADGFLEDSVVVIMGDHTRMAGPLDDLLGKTEDRPIFNRIWQPDGRQIAVSEMDQLSMFPTILDAMGFTVEDGRAGLGVSGYLPGSQHDTLRWLSDDDRRTVIASRSQHFYDGLWNYSPDTFAGVTDE